ncbi:hypothetical protein Tco_1226243 [Tanacetum coccineum]
MGTNFIDWYRQLRFGISTEDKEYYLGDLSAAPAKRKLLVLMLLTWTMDLDIQWILAHLGAYDMLQDLKAMFSKLAEHELLQTLREFHTCKQKEGQSVSSYNYNMHDMGKIVNELHAMLKLHEDTLPKKDANPALHAIRAGRVQKNQKNKPHKAAALLERKLNLEGLPRPYQLILDKLELCRSALGAL